ncbi:helix-turn-helix domain-containing protein [Jiella avicenniae]|uniref:Helix-turn-helix domain-containing protein n=1 Tax=Jiella avicenniae TaxID=2907202 RepID=A0A9X1P485_9HYPH|nr:helix-turn-helix domain-containing protein [Jiella avicenniae]
MASSSGKRLAKARAEAGMNASDLARAAGVSSTAVWNWEKNGTMPREDKIALIAKAIGVSTEFLRTGLFSDGQAAHTSPGRGKTVADVIAGAQREISQITGVPIDRVKIRVEFESD